MSNVLRYPQALVERDTFGVFDDFLADQSDTFFIDVVTDSGTAAVGDAVGGVMVLTPSDGTVADNDEAYLKTANEIFKLASGKPIYGECRLQFTEINTDDANVFFGFLDAIAANTIVDNGAGLDTSFSGAAIYKVDGGTVWKCISSNGATQTISTSTTTAGGSAYQVLGIEFIDYTGTHAQVVFTVDGVRLRDSNGREIVHTVAYSGATEMNLGCGVKNGDTNLETLNVDYIGGWQTR